MTSDINTGELLHSPDEASRLLDIKDSTLRKYAGLLKKHGYIFQTNSKGHRGYFDAFA